MGAPIKQFVPRKEETLDGDRTKIHNLLYQAHETGRVGVQIYEVAVRIAENFELKEEWKFSLAQTLRHLAIVEQTMQAFNLSPGHPDPGRVAVRHTGTSLVQAMILAEDSDDREMAELVAAESVMLVETKNHLNWDLLGKIAKELGGPEGVALTEAHLQSMAEVNAHLEQAIGWTRELWLKCLGLPAVLPPPSSRRNSQAWYGR